MEVVWMDGWMAKPCRQPSPNLPARGLIQGCISSRDILLSCAPKARIEMLIRPETKRHTSRPPKSQLADLWGHSPGRRCSW